MRTVMLSEGSLRRVILEEKERFETNILFAESLYREIYKRNLDPNTVTREDIGRIISEAEEQGLFGNLFQRALGATGEVISKHIAMYFIEYLGLRPESLFGQLIAEVFENAPVVSYVMGNVSCEDLAPGIAEAIGETFTEPIGKGVLEHLGVSMGDVFGQIIYEGIQKDLMLAVTRPLALAIQDVICAIDWQDILGLITGGFFGSDPGDVEAKITAAARRRAAESQEQAMLGGGAPSTW